MLVRVLCVYLLVAYVSCFAGAKMKRLEVLYYNDSIINTSDVYDAVYETGVCTVFFNLIKKNDQVITGLPLFNIPSNQSMIRESAIIVIMRC